jgi:hypothetical protein
MGILLGFLLICLIIYAALVTNGVYFFLKMVIVDWVGFKVNLIGLWTTVNFILWIIAMRFIWFLVEDARGGTPNMDGVWKFYWIITTVLFLIVFLLGYKSK